MLLQTEFATSILVVFSASWLLAMVFILRIYVQAGCMKSDAKNRVDGLYPITARVSYEQRNQLKAFAARTGDQMQTVIKKALNTYLVKNGENPIFDETEGPQGAAAHRKKS